MTLNYWKQPLAAVPAEVWTTPDPRRRSCSPTPGSRTWPDAIGRLAALRMLDLAPQLPSRPAAGSGDSARWRRLVELRVERTTLTSLPSSIGRLAALRELHAGGNGLEALPETIGDLAEPARAHAARQPSASATGVDGAPVAPAHARPARQPARRLAGRRSRSCRRSRSSTCGGWRCRRRHRGSGRCAPAAVSSTCDGNDPEWSRPDGRPLRSRSARRAG